MSVNEKQLVKLQNPYLDWSEKVKEAKNQYKYQKELTVKLDAHTGDFTEKTLLEIVLWKTNRYPVVTPASLALINELRHQYSDKNARTILKELLESKGFDLPMASTILRFACPEHLQIIDQRVYRLITPGKEKLKIPYGNDQKIELYFEYIENLKKVCLEYNIEFRIADRVLYMIDKLENGDIPIKY